MIRFLITLLGLFLLAIGGFVIYNSGNTFQAKFKNIDGLPVGAPVTALGIDVGEVARTIPVNDGVIVTVKTKNKSFPKLPPGSQLTITTFGAGQGKVLEVIPPNEALDDNAAWIVQEPITTESWIHASVELFDEMQKFSEFIIRKFTPENFDKMRSSFSEASESLEQTVQNLKQHQQKLTDLKEDLATKANDANQLLVQLQKPIAELNSIISDKGLASNFKGGFDEFSENLDKLSKNITDPKVVTNIKSFKSQVLNNLNEINTSLSALDETVTDPELTTKLKDFNQHVKKLNQFYEGLDNEKVTENVKKSVEVTKELTTTLEKTTTELANDSKEE